jgi:hypothetical protein
MSKYGAFEIVFSKVEDRTSFLEELEKHELSLGDYHCFAIEPIIKGVVFFLSENYEVTATNLVAAYGAWQKYNQGYLRITNDDDSEVELKGKTAEKYYKQLPINNPNFYINGSKNLTATGNITQNNYYAKPENELIDIDNEIISHQEIIQESQVDIILKRRKPWTKGSKIAIALQTLTGVSFITYEYIYPIGSDNFSLTPVIISMLLFLILFIPTYARILEVREFVDLKESFIKDSKDLLPKLKHRREILIKMINVRSADPHDK